ncbi:MAG: hypothetical protein U9Q82_05025, partial [Chloroflexota bacterium]|nr:hypothetical protein [Chloroflexota bacterium]
LERSDLFADIIRELVPGFVHQGVVIEIIELCHGGQTGVVIAATPSQWYNQNTMYIDEFI